MKQEIIVPESLAEISLKKYIEFSKVAKNCDGEFLMQKMVSIFCDIPLANIGRIKLNSLLDIVDHLNGLFEKDIPLKQTFRLPYKEVNDVEFGFIPSIEDITLDEYSDLDNYINDIENINKAMAVMYRPITNKQKDSYLIEPYNGSANYSEVMMYAPLDVVLGARVFFWNLETELLKDTTNSLVEEMEMEISQNKLSSEILGDGIKVFTDSLKETSQNLTSLGSFQFINALRSSHLRNKRTKSNNE